VFTEGCTQDNMNAINQTGQDCGDGMMQPSSESFAALLFAFLIPKSYINILQCLEWGERYNIKRVCESESE
jgi:hypothetical protein